MTYDPDRTNMLPYPGQAFPITEELPVVAPRGRGPSGRFLLGFLTVLLVAGIGVIAAVLIVDDQRSTPVAGSSTPVPSVDPDATAVPTPTELEDDEPGFWQVVGVTDGLNVRSGPGTDNEIVGSLRLGDRHILSTGERATVNGREWKQIRFGSNDTIGWVSASFLATDVAPDEAEPTPTANPTGSTSIVCFRSAESPIMIARLTFTDRTNISGVLRATDDQTVAGTLNNGRADVVLTTTGSGQQNRQTWTFSPASVDLGTGRTMQVVDCESIAGQLP